jgi:hypothetical protein
MREIDPQARDTNVHIGFHHLNDQYSSLLAPQIDLNWSIDGLAAAPKLNVSSPSLQANLIPELIRA